MSQPAPQPSKSKAMLVSLKDVHPTIKSANMAREAHKLSSGNKGRYHSKPPNFGTHKLRRFTDLVPIPFDGATDKYPIDALFIIPGPQGVNVNGANVSQPVFVHDISPIELDGSEVRIKGTQLPVKEVQNHISKSFSVSVNGKPREISFMLGGGDRQGIFAISAENSQYHSKPVLVAEQLSIMNIRS